jgi:hypothetical protein
VAGRYGAAEEIYSFFSDPVHAHLTIMVKTYNGANFGWYFSKAETFSGIFLKCGSFDGTELIFPYRFHGPRTVTRST